MQKKYLNSKPIYIINLSTNHTKWTRTLFWKNYPLKKQFTLKTLLKNSTYRTKLCIHNLSVSMHWITLSLKIKKSLRLFSLKKDNSMQMKEHPKLKYSILQQLKELSRTISKNKSVLHSKSVLAMPWRRKLSFLKKILSWKLKRHSSTKIKNFFF
jgi:hypothetical protein